MRAFVRNWALVVLPSLLSLPSTSAPANNRGVYLPPSPQGSGGEDSIETSSGTRCRQSINSNGAYLDLGAVGSAAKPLGERITPFVGSDRDQEALAYARVTIPLGARPKRIDCSTIYELEITKLRQEVELLKMGVQ